MRAPTPDEVLGVIEYLPRDGHVVLERMDEPEVYIEVWLRPEGSYQLELRHGSVKTHQQTRSVSGERVAAAFTGWLEEPSGDGDATWRDGHQWTNISATLTNTPEN
jgi:hypothetical protein